MRLSHNFKRCCAGTQPTRWLSGIPKCCTHHPPGPRHLHPPRQVRPRVRIHRVFMARIPKVLLLIESSRASGRALLQGITRFAHDHGPWSFYWEPAGLEKGWPKLASLDLQGMIVRDVGD